MAKVLVIDGEEWVAELLRESLREAGYLVSVVGTAQAGLDAARGERPDCIICDVDLPDGDGHWVATQVRCEPSRLSVVPFLFLTKLHESKRRLESLQVGGDVCVTKPFRLDEVLGQVAALMQRSSRIRDVQQSSGSPAPPARRAAVAPPAVVAANSPPRRSASDPAPSSEPLSVEEVEPDLTSYRPPRP